MINDLINLFKGHWRLFLFIGIILFILVRIKVRGFFWKVRKTNEELTLKEFFKLWGKGVEGITPLQQAKANILGVWIVITGLIAGIVTNLVVRLKDTWWWLTIILVGSLFLTIIQTIGFYQRYKILKRVEIEVNKLKEEKNGTEDKEEESNEEVI